MLTENAPTPEAAPAFTGMAFFVGYLMASVGPVAAGALRDATGGYATVFAVLAVFGVLTLGTGVAAARHDRSSGTVAVPFYALIRVAAVDATAVGAA